MLGADLNDIVASAKRAGQALVVDVDDWFWDTPNSPLSKVH